MNQRILVYGATGYTGRLVAAEAARRKLDVVLAGRDETKLEALITPKTKAIVVVHYAGVACEMDAIGEIARRHDVAVIEDALAP